MQAGLRHQDEQADRLQGYGLAAGIGSGNDECTDRRRDLQVDRHGSGWSGVLFGGWPSVAGSRTDGGDQQRMSGFRQLDSRIRRELRLHAGHETGETGPRLDDVELFGRGQRPAQVEGAPAERIRQTEQNAVNFLPFRLLEGDDVVIDLDRAQRLQKQARSAARAAMHDARNCRAVFRPDHQHEPAAPFGYHPLLEVLRRIPSAQVRFERAAQSVTLSSQPIPQRAQFGTGVVEHLAFGIDGGTNGADLLFEGMRAVDDGFERRIGSSRGIAERRAGGVHRGQKTSQTHELLRLDDTALHGEQGDNQLQLGGGVEAERGIRLEVGHSLAGGGESGCDLVGIGLRGKAVERRGPQRCERQAADRGYDTIEFKRQEGSLMHRCFRSRPERRRLRQLRT